MKKTLAIVLALVMVLCMIPAMSATITETKEISGKSYTIAINSVGEEVTGKSASGVNSLEWGYDYEKLAADVTGKFTDDAKMAIVTVDGFFDEFSGAAQVTIDGKKLAADSLASYSIGYDASEDAVKFPVELTKAGYSDTYLIQVTETAGGKTITETAKISLKLVNTAAYKDGKTANILDVESSDKKSLDAYIVGSKLYLDFVDAAAAGEMGETVTITFGDENKKAFTATTWAYKPTNAQVKLPNATYLTADKVWGIKLSDSAAAYSLYDIAAADGTKVTFELETASAFYKTKEYTIVVRKGIKVSDPKGVIFQDSTKTIAMGETYAPKLVGVANNKVLTPDALYYGTNTSEQVIDIDGVKVIGTREGVAYITASYKADKTGTAYTSNSMKIVVTAGESIPPVVKTEVYYVTCRNLNVRKGAGTSYAKAGMIHRGDAVEVVEIKGGWAQLANGTYVCAKYIAK